MNYNVLIISSRKLHKTVDNDVSCCSPKDTLCWLCMFGVFQKGSSKWVLASVPRTKSSVFIGIPKYHIRCYECKQKMVNLTDQKQCAI